MVKASQFHTKLSFFCLRNIVKKKQKLSFMTLASQDETQFPPKNKNSFHITVEEIRCV